MLGPPPVYVGFGSAPDQNAEEAGALVLKALARAGQRGVLMTGWGGLPEAPHLPSRNLAGSAGLGLVAAVLAGIAGMLAMRKRRMDGEAPRAS